MTERTHDQIADDQALDEYLKGGSLASQRYRESADDFVPPELERRVLTMAREAAARPTKARVWMRWTAPLAVAASAVVVLAIVMDQGAREQAAVSTIEAPREAAADASLERRAMETPRVETQAAPPPAMKMDAPPVAAPREAAPAFVPPPDAGRAEQEVQAREIRKRIEREGASMRASGDVAAATPAPRVDTEEVTVTAQSASNEAPEAVGVTSAISISATRPAVADVVHSDPKRWLEEIRNLREQGKSEDADREWDRFREAYPEYPVAESDLARKKEQ